MNPVIEIKDLVIKYGEFTAIEDFNLNVKQGEIVTLFGPSGCGKSTILKAILGIINPFSGIININGIKSCEYKLPMAYTPQTNELLPWKTVEQNVELWYNETKQKFNTAFCIEPKAAIDKVEMSSAMKKLPKALSGGMERRSALARCMATNSDIMLFDEAFVSVERKLRRQLMENIRNQIKEKGITAISISHDYEEAVFMSDRIILLTANPTIIKKEVIITLTEKRDTSIFEKDEFLKQSVQLIH